MSLLGHSNPFVDYPEIFRTTLEFGLYLKDFKQRNDMIDLVFWKGHFGYIVEKGLGVVVQGAKLKAQKSLRWLQ